MKIQIPYFLPKQPGFILEGKTSIQDIYSPPQQIKYMSVDFDEDDFSKEKTLIMTKLISRILRRLLK